MSCWGLGLALLLALSACTDNDAYIERIKEQGKLVVVTRNAPTTYYEGRDGATGFEYDLVSAFAERAGG